ncbi:MAG: hypothetical protein ACI8PG_002081 [Planctomycetota bacterium]|jgi:hypothetical protein
MSIPLPQSYYNQAINAIKLLYGKVLKRPKEIEVVQRPRREQRLPTVLSRQTVERMSIRRLIQRGLFAQSLHALPVAVYI